ncbi:hypothetical protein MBFIL_06290 [Methanobrevibacter filiformis]|uniref:Uncharacterized protein n=2 Tax=Methanobrevibacter filiformis TaxID=55758 RepID=A0A166DFY0_9EURY|nr:hypothetical protein MBFIL_06290 [Methanobrevibacter filiformis]
MNCDEALKYIIDNVKIYDTLELSYNRVFTPGEVLNVDTSEYHGKPGLKVVIHVLEDTFTSSVEVDLEEVKDELIEFKHIPKNSNNETIVIIDRCEDK